MIISLCLFSFVLSCSFSPRKAPKEKLFNTSDKAIYLVKRSKALRYKGKFEDAIDLLNKASLNYFASGNKKRYLLTRVQYLILSLTHNKNFSFEKELSRLSNFNQVNHLKLEIPLNVLKVHYYHIKKNQNKALNLLEKLLKNQNNLKRQIYFLGLKIEIKKYKVTKRFLIELEKKVELYEKDYSDEESQNMEFLSKSFFNLGRGHLNHRDFKSASFWFERNYELNKGLEHYVKLIPTLEFLEKCFKELNNKKKRAYYKNLKGSYQEFLNSL